MFHSNKIHVIGNPHAAHGLVRKRWPHILKYFETEGFELAAQLTNRKLHACYLAKTAVKNGARCLVSIGGEGTFNEIVNGVLKATTCSEHMPDLVMIPMGTGIDFSRTLHLPKDYRESADLIRGGVTKLFDIGKIIFNTHGMGWERYFVNVFDVGLGGNVVRIANHIPKNLGGFLTFLLSSFVALISFKPIRLRVYIDNKFIDEGLMTIVGALNGQYFGGGMRAAPMASPDDGILEFIYVKDANIFKIISKVLAKVYEGKHLEYHNVYHCRGRELRIESNKIFLVDIDGEEGKAHNVTVSIIPKAIKIKVPKGCV